MPESPEKNVQAAKKPLPVFKVTVIVILASSIIIPLALVAMPYIEFFNDMAVQPKGKAQGTYGWFFGKELTAERAPVPGTLPRGYHPYPIDDPNETRAQIAAGKLLRNPRAKSMDSFYRGQFVYNTYCIVCHGRWGDGDGPVIGPERFPAPPSLHENAKKYPDGRIYHIITRGRGQMPGYAVQIVPEDRWHAVNYLRVLQKKREMELQD